MFSVSTKYTGLDGSDEKFIFTFYILFFQCVCSAVASKLGTCEWEMFFGLFIIAVIVLFRLPGNTCPPTSYIVVSLTFILAQFFSFHALLYVTYPTQVLAKSCKPIPGTYFALSFRISHFDGFFF